jgi:hypothetical protein
MIVEFARERTPPPLVVPAPPPEVPNPMPVVE